MKKAKTYNPIWHKLPQIDIDYGLGSSPRGMHIGHKAAFGSWKLIWFDETTDQLHVFPISEKLAKALTASGMSYEG